MTHTLRRTLPLALTSVLLAAGAALAPATTSYAGSGPSLAGTWSGPVYGDNGAPAGYTESITLKKKRNGTFKAAVADVTNGCSGTWKQTSVRGKTYHFEEDTTSGPCASNVDVKVKLSGSTLQVTYTEQGGDVATLAATRS